MSSKKKNREIEQLREALEPFAGMWRSWLDIHPEKHILLSVNIDWIRAAVSALDSSVQTDKEAISPARRSMQITRMVDKLSEKDLRLLVCESIRTVDRLLEDLADWKSLAESKKDSAPAPTGSVSESFEVNRPCQRSDGLSDNDSEERDAETK